MLKYILLSFMTLSLVIPNGTLKGTVYYKGSVPKPKSLSMDADPVCGKQHAKPVRSEKFTARKVKDSEEEKLYTLKDVMIWIKGAKGDLPTEPAILNQVGCVYEPHVLPVMKGQTVLIQNNDPTLHNVHSMPEVNTSFNFAMPKVVKEKETVFDKVEDPFYIKCDVHPWMKSWVVVTDNPYFASTDKYGNYSIEGIPAGEYEVVFWQEKFGMKRAQTMTVTISEEGVTTQDVRFEQPKKK